MSSPYRGHDSLHCDTGLVHVGWHCPHPICTHSHCTKVFLHSHTGELEAVRGTWSNHRPWDSFGNFLDAYDAYLDGRLDYRDLPFPQNKPDVEVRMVSALPAAARAAIMDVLL